MCLAVPGQIKEIYQQDGMTMGKVDFGGTTREVCLAYTPEAQVGDWAVVHVGFALNLLSPEEAEETLALLRQMAEAGDGNEVAEAGDRLPASDDRN